MTRIKMCGITNVEDAMAAVDCGADAIGFVFADSPRRVNASTAKRIVDALPPFVSAIGVFVSDDHDILQIARDCGLDTVQLHGEQDEVYAECLADKLRVIRVVRVRDAVSLAALKNYGIGSAYLLDTFSKEKMGGTGQVFNWELAVRAKEYGKPIILSGGLTTNNVNEAIRLVRPYAVDVSSGVEMAPGKKDHLKMKEFVENVGKADATA